MREKTFNFCYENASTGAKLSVNHEINMSMGLVDIESAIKREMRTVKVPRRIIRFDEIFLALWLEGFFTYEDGTYKIEIRNATEAA